MGRRRRRRLHARPAGSQPPETRAAAAAEEPRSEGTTGGSLTGRGSKRASVADSAPEKDKRRKLEVGDDGETTEEDEMAADRNGSDRNGSDQAVAEQVKTDQNGSNGGGSDENGDEGAGGGSSDPGPLLREGDSETSIQVTCGRNEGRLYLTKLRVVVNERCRSKCIRTGNTWWTPNEFQFVSGRGAAKDWKRTVKHAGRCLKALLASGTLSLSSATPRCFCESCTSQGSGKTADDSDEAGRNINESGEDLSNGKLAQDDSNIRKKGIKRGRRIKRHIKGAAPLHGDTSEEPVPFASRKRRKFRRNAKPEAHSDSTVSLSADGIFESGTGSKATEEGGTVAKSSDASSPVVAPVPEPPLVVKRRPGRPKKKPAVAVPTKTPDVALRKETKVKVTAEKGPISGQGVSLIGANDGPTGCPDDATPSSERPQDSPAGQTRTGPVGENVLPENYSPRLNDIALAIPQTPTSKASPEQPEATAATSEQTSKNDDLAQDTSRSNGTISETPATTHDVQRTTHDVQRTTHDVQRTTLADQATTHDASPETDALPSDGKAEQESVDEASTYGASDQLPVCPSDNAPSGDMEAQDGVDADRKQTEDEAIVSGDVKDDVKKGLSPVRDDVTETSLTAPNPTEPRRKNAYLNAVIAELKRKKISRETSVTSCSGAKDQQQHQRTRHPSGQLQQPTTLHPTTAVSSIKTELCPESKSTSDSLIRDIQSPSFGLITSSSASSSSNPSLAFLPSTLVDGKLPCLKPLHPDAEGKDAAAPDVRSGSGTRRTDSRTSARGNIPMSDFPPSEAAYWRHLQSSMVGAEGKAGGGGGGKPGVGGRVADMSSPISISQLASICGLSQSQLASLPFPPPQFSLYPPYLFMGFPLQPLLPEFQSASGSLPPSPAAAATTTGGHGSVQRPPSRPVPPAASSSSSTTTAPSSQYQQQQPRRRRSHHHHHCKSSSSSSASGPPKDPLFRQPPPDRHAASFSALRKTEAIPTNHSAALISEQNRWRSTTPGLSNNQPWTGSTTKSSAPNKFSPTGSSVQERKLWRPAAAIASSAKEYSSAYESIVASRPSAHASTKEFAVTCRSYGDTSLAAHAYRFDSSAPVDFTRRFRARDEEERKYSSNTGSEEYPCDEQGVLDLSKK